MKYSSVLYFPMSGYSEEAFGSWVVVVWKLTVTARGKVMEGTGQGGLRPNGLHARTWKDHTEVY